MIEGLKQSLHFSNTDTNRPKRPLHNLSSSEEDLHQPSNKRATSNGREDNTPGASSSVVQGVEHTSQQENSSLAENSPADEEETPQGETTSKEHLEGIPIPSHPDQVVSVEMEDLPAVIESSNENLSSPEGAQGGASLSSKGTTSPSPNTPSKPKPKPKNVPSHVATPGNMKNIPTPKGKKPIKRVSGTISNNIPK